MISKGHHTVQITPIPAFTDNYIWAVHDNTSCFVVDPGDACPVLQFLREKGLSLRGLLITHHHYDHTGGILPLSQQYSALSIYGPYNDAISGITHRVKQGDAVPVLGKTFHVMDTPGHTLDHIAYFANGGENTDDKPILFCGDTLFSGGCGRLFEGTPQQMQASLDQLATLPDDTQICCAHEYTEANLAFARSVEPDNQALKARVNDVVSLRQQHRPTLPSTLLTEKQSNPFMRSRVKTVVHHAQKHSDNPLSSPSAVLRTIRQLKDSF